MQWFDNIDELQYYNQPIGVPCYCDPLIEPNDLILQAVVPFSLGYSLRIEVLSADGLTVYEDATPYFEWYVFQAPNGIRYLNMRLKAYSPAMCSHACFILKVNIWSSGSFGSGNPFFFKKYTERYCVDNCCVLPSDVTIKVIRDEPV